MRPWSEAERKENARQCMAVDIDRHPLGRQLTPEARAKAIEFAADAWSGQTNAGAAAELGVRHVTSDVIKPK